VAVVARFYKTRSLAARAVEGGKVKLNGERVKPGKEVKAGRRDRGALRGSCAGWWKCAAWRSSAVPAAEAALLYAESGESRVRREQMIAMRRAEPHPAHERMAGHQARPAHDPALHRRVSANAWIA